MNRTNILFLALTLSTPLFANKINRDKELYSLAYMQIFNECDQHNDAHLECVENAIAHLKPKDFRNCIINYEALNAIVEQQCTTEENSYCKDARLAKHGLINVPMCKRLKNHEWLTALQAKQKTLREIPCPEDLDKEAWQKCQKMKILGKTLPTTQSKKSIE